jgi:hypothetical protein
MQIQEPDSISYALSLKANFVQGLGIFATRHEIHLEASGSTSLKSYFISKRATTTFMNADA